MFLLATPGGVQAQTTPPSSVDREAERLQQQQLDQARARADQFQRDQARPPSGDEITAAASAEAEGSGCAPVAHVKIVGMSRHSERDFETVTASLVSPCTSVKAIDQALRAITNRYVADGYITSRAFVGPQSIRDGVLTITVFEGRVSGLKGVGKPAYGPSEIGAAFPARKGDLLNLRALEQGVDQLARMPSGDPGIDVAPGDEPATSTVIVKRGAGARRIRPSLSFTNDGATSTGRLMGTATLDADSLLGIADSWSLYYSHNLQPSDQRGTESFGGFLSIPYGWYTLTLSAGASDYRSVLAGNGLAFASTGRSWNASATLDRMMYRNARTKLSLSGGLSVIDTANFIQGIELRTGSYRLVTATVGVHDQMKLGAGVLGANLAFNKGLALLGAHAVDTGPGGPTRTFDTLSGDLSYQRPLSFAGIKALYSGLIRVQWGLSNVFPAESFSLGGSSTVRGFRDDGISGRSGAMTRQQISAGLFDLAATSPVLRTQVSGFVGYDGGLIFANKYNVYERGLLQSMTVGVRAQGRHLQSEFALAVPISAPSWVRHRDLEFSASVRVML